MKLIHFFYLYFGFCLFRPEHCLHVPSAQISSTSWGVCFAKMCSCYHFPVCLKTNPIPSSGCHLDDLYAHLTLLSDWLQSFPQTEAWEWSLSWFLGLIRSFHRVTDAARSRELDTKIIHVRFLNSAALFPCKPDQCDLERNRWRGDNDRPLFTATITDDNLLLRLTADVRHSRKKTIEIGILKPYSITFHWVHLQWNTFFLNQSGERGKMSHFSNFKCQKTYIPPVFVPNQDLDSIMICMHLVSVCLLPYRSN